MAKASKAAKQEYSFTLILSGVKSIDELEAGIYGAGCDDASIGYRCGIPFVAFDREADSMRSALESAISDVRAIGSHIGIVRIEPDDVVNMSQIAKRIRQSRESIRKYVKDERKGGKFPAPVSNVTGSSMRWRWTEVAGWLSENVQTINAPALAEAAEVSKLNAALELRRLTKTKAELLKVLQLVQ